MSTSRNYFFPEATTYPDFFNHNLTDDNRVLKVVSGGYCWARAFYYQLLKVIFEFETEQQNPINYGQLLLRKSKETIQRIPDSQSDHILASYLPILSNFIEKLSQNCETPFEDYINSHPQIDEALINIFSLMLSQSNYLEASTEQKIKYLGQIFQETMYQFQKGVKFEQSDTFLYFERQDKVYIAFLNYVSDFDQYQPDAGSKEDTVSIQKQTEKNKVEILPNKAISNKQQKEGQDGRGGQNQGYQYVTTSIIPIRQTVQAAINTILQKQHKKQSPVQYLFQNRFRSNSNSIQPSNPPGIPSSSLPQQIKSPFDNVKESSLPTSNREQQVSLVKNMDRSENSNSNSNHMEFTLGKKNEDIYGNKFSEPSEESLKIFNTIQVKRLETIEDINDVDYYKYKKRTSDVVQRKVNDYPRSSVHQQDQDVFYKPVSNRNVQNQIGKPVAKKDPLDVCNDSEKGTFYRKFTDTRILNLLSEPYRTKVKMLKNRFIGVHSRGYRPPVYEQQQF